MSAIPITKSNSSSKQKPRGFTVVELMIVIVVIAILVAITIFGYGAVRSRSLNTARLAAGKEMMEILNTYVAINQDYPRHDSNNDRISDACIGEGYTSWDGDSTPDCNAKGLYVVSTKDELNNKLRKVTGSLPIVPQEIMKSNASGVSYRGISYFANGQHVDGALGENAIIFVFLEGANLDCGAPVLVRSGPPGSGQYATSSSAKNTEVDGNVTRCTFMVDSPRDY